jgi:RNA polymerase sigma-70 factor, ECF subfamily
MTGDDQLMLRFQQGSREAFCELFERYRDPLYGFFRRRLDHPSRAEELTQECFLVLLRNAARYEPRGGFRSYLYGIAIHLLSNERRKAGREVAPSEDSACPANHPNTDETLWVRRALAELDANDREILMLREYEQLPYADIAAILRLPVNTVRSRLFRARIALKEKLMPVNGDFEGLV